MDLFLTGRLGPPASHPWSEDGEQGGARRGATDRIPTAPSQGKASDLASWRALLRELAP